MNKRKTVLMAAALTCFVWPARLSAQDARWEEIQRVFALKGESDDGYFRIDLPRSDLHVRMGSVEMDPGLGLTSYVAFVPLTAGRVMAIGEVVSTEDEAPRVVAEARHANVSVSALHNHELGETPRMVYIHFTASGNATDVAARVRDMFAKTAVPMHPSETPARSTSDWSAVDKNLGRHVGASGRVVEYSIKRVEPHAIHGIGVKSSDVLETASEIAMQDLGGGKAALMGELYLLPSEIDRVTAAIAKSPFHVTALHNHMVNEAPVMYWLHFFGTGEKVEVSRSAASIIRLTKSRF